MRFTLRGVDVVAPIGDRWSLASLLVHVVSSLAAASSQGKTWQVGPARPAWPVTASL